MLCALYFSFEVQQSFLCVCVCVVVLWILDKEKLPRLKITWKKNQQQQSAYVFMIKNSINNNNKMSTKAQWKAAFI